jgi:hypothetical protein
VLLYAALAAGAARADATPLTEADDEPPPRPQPLVFLHIPKTGGTSLALTLQRFLGELNCTRDALGDDDPQPGNETCVWAHAFPGKDHDERLFLARAAVGAAGRNVKLDYLMGHLHFGSCILLNATLPKRAPCVYTTVLRDPLARIVSHYRWLMRAAPHVLLRRCPECTTIDAFAAAINNGTMITRLYLENTQTRVLSGDGFWASITNNRLRDVALLADSEMLERAKANLASAAVPFFGLTEDMPAYVRRLRAFLGLPPAAGAEAAARMVVANAAPDALSAEALSPRTRELLLESQAQDVHLYEFAKRLLAARGGAA